MSRALQINSSPQGWMARNTKPVPLAEKGWVMTMKKISIILLSAVLVFSMAACNGGKEKADNQTEKQTESVKPTEEVSITAEVDTEATTEVVSEVTSEPLTETEEPAEKDNPSDKKSTDQQKTSNQEVQRWQKNLKRQRSSSVRKKSQMIFTVCGCTLTRLQHMRKQDSLFLSTAMREADCFQDRSVSVGSIKKQGH